MKMEVHFGPNSVDEPNLLYKLQNKVQVFNSNNKLTNRGYCLIASSSKYGVVFVASPNGVLSVYNINQLLDKECTPHYLPVFLKESPTHIAVSCDYELLAVAGTQGLYIYKVIQFQSQNGNPIAEIKFSLGAPTFVSALQWNPCIPDTIAIAFYDGTLLAAQITPGDIKTKQIASKARCICWSPKGKQLVTGNSDGTLCQYKPDLTPAKTVPAPNLFEGAPVEALAIHWISTFQFAVVYRNAGDNSRPSVTLVNTPKAGTPSCINYEDVCFSTGSDRPWYYYLHGIAQWNIILASSSNSMEIATLGSNDGANWVHWTQPDTGRPELPLTGKQKQENYPVGLCIDTCAVHQIPWGENEMLPHMPLLFIVSQTGMLTIFNIVNLNKAAAQICAPPQMLALPNVAMTSDIPDDTPKEQPPAPAPVSAPAPAPLPVATPHPPMQPTMPVPTPVHRPPMPAMTQFGSAAQPLKPPSYAQSTNNANIGNQTIEKPKAIPATQVTQASVPPPVKATQQIKSPVVQSPEVNTALKAEQERLNKLKADQELRNMLIREVNEFQSELYTFMVMSEETQKKVFRDVDAITLGLNMQTLDAEQLKKECSMEELRNAIIQLKLELVRACAVVAEARTQAETKELPQWTQADPLTTKRMDSVKKLAYYVETQLDRAQKALDYKWTEMAMRDDQSNKSVPRMIRPILDDVYRPLVRQQEILGRQEAVLRTMKNTLKDCGTTPILKSTSILRSTPFKKDPLSKLTKNILNMSIEAHPKAKELFSAQKLDALKDVLSNHKTIKVKPVNVELRQRLDTMRRNYEKSKAQEIKEPTKPLEVVRPAQHKPIIPPAPVPVVIPSAPIVRQEPKVDIVKQPVSVPSFTPVSNLKPTGPVVNVARTLFVDEPKPQPITPQSQIQQTKNAPFPSFTPTPVAPPIDTRSVLKDLLQNKQALLEAKNEAQKKTINIEAKNDNTFMGQKICSPSAFTPSVTPVATTSTSSIFASKPIAGMNSMFDKLNQNKGWGVSITPEPKTQEKPKSVETGETAQVTIKEKPKEEKLMSNLFAMKPTVKTETIPDVLKSNTGFSFGKDKSLNTVVEKLTDKSKENVPEKPVENISKSGTDSQKENKQVLSTSEPERANTVEATIKIPVPRPIAKPLETKTDKVAPPIEKPTSPSASSLFAAANAAAAPSPTATKPQSIFGSPTSAPTSAFALPKQPETTAEKETVKPTVFGTTITPTTVEPSSPVSTATEAKTVATAVESKPTTPSTPTQDPKSLFAAQTASVFGATSPSSAFNTTTAKSVFESAVATTTSALGNQTSTASIFGVATTKSVFDTATTSSTPAFGGTPLFGGTSASTQSVFGSTTQSSAFGTTTTTQSLFGSTSTPTTSSVFGTAVTTASMFGTAFGATTTTTQSLFGTGTATTQSAFGTTPAFGTTTTPSAFSQSVFGSTPTTQTSVFGSNQGSIFGQSTQSSVFGTTTVSTAQSGSLFGGAEENLFSSVNISTTSAPSPGSGGNIFGTGSPQSGSAFGSNTTNVFGGKSSFGQSSSSASIFGGSASFGQKPASNFWSGNSGNTSSFGSTGFGQQATTQPSSIFGGGTGGSFSTPSSPGQAFGSPQPAAFGGENKTSVFGSPQQQAAPAFGGGSVFGGKPVFGQSAAFGSPPASGGFGSFGGFNKSPNTFGSASPTFGAAPAFGGSAFGGSSPGAVFGGQSPSFGSPTQSNATFESLATQDTLTFGNLAQQSGPTQQPPPSFNQSPAFTGWRG